MDLLKSWNILPAGVVGHSSGEIAAAYAAGAISQDTAIRVSYHRSFLSEAAKERAPHQSAMMAVGLDEAEVQVYIDHVTSARVVVACVNSPSSTTVSGDTTAVEELKQALDTDGIFARRLKVDTAYHSHHMKLVKNDYLDRLGPLEAGIVNSTVRLFSSVTGEDKTGGFEAPYKVDNLFSQVRFDAAVQQLYQDLQQSQLTFIEIGPHKALAGPLQQIMAVVAAEAASYSYVPIVVRGEDTRSSLLQTAAILYGGGAEINIGAATSVAFTKPTGVVLPDLPKYHWKHSVTNWNEARLSRDHMMRRHPHHDLLGLRILTSPDSQPSWRNIQRTDMLPWLKDHVIDNFVVFPAAA